MTVKFGEQRLVRPDVGTGARLLFRAMGVADAAHYLHHRLLDRTLSSFAGFEPQAILDAGCGGGDHSIYLARRFPQARVLGIDIDSRLIERNISTARQLGLTNLRFECADITKVAFKERFDLIVSVDVLEHIPAQQVALENLSSVLTTVGRVFFHIPTVRERPVPFSKWLSGFHEWAEGEHVADELTADEFAARVERAGIEVTAVTRTFGYFTGELATSLIALPYAESKRNRLLQALLAPFCRVLAIADMLNIEDTRYAVAVVGRKA